MPLHIDDAKVDRLAKELSEITGEPVGVAVAKALEEQLKKQKEVQRVLKDIHRISDHYMSLPVLDSRSPDEILGYDENGLPT